MMSRKWWCLLSIDQKLGWSFRAPGNACVGGILSSSVVTRCTRISPEFSEYILFRGMKELLLYVNGKQQHRKLPLWDDVFWKYSFLTWLRMCGIICTYVYWTTRTAALGSVRRPASSPQSRFLRPSSFVTHTYLLVPTTCPEYYLIAIRFSDFFLGILHGSEKVLFRRWSQQAGTVIICLEVEDQKQATKKRCSSNLR